MNSIIDRLAKAPDDIHDLAVEWPLIFLLKLPPKARIVVVGAYEGRVMELLATAYPDYDKMLAFEPQKDKAELALNRLYGLHGIIIETVALHDSSGKVQLTSTGSYHARVADQGDYEVEAWDIARLNYDRPVDLLLMNVEGAEGRLLRRLWDQGKLTDGTYKRVVVQFHDDYDSFDDVYVDLDEVYNCVYDDLPRWGYWKAADA